MKEPRLYVDFNEMLEENLVMLSQNDIKYDSEGNEIKLFNGLEIKIYMEDYNEFDERDDLYAEGLVERNNYEFCKIVKWNCRINDKGIYNESDLI